MSSCTIVQPLAWLTVVYALLIGAVGLTRCLPLLRQWTLHGKLRKEKQASSDREAKSATLLLLDQLQRWWVPKRFFLHFYVCGMLAFLAVEFWGVMQRSSSSDLGIPPLLALALFGHLTRRILECLLIHKWRQDSQMHITIYAVGLLHYLLLPLVFVQEDTSKYNRMKSWVVLMIGVVINIFAQYEQHMHHVLLANLRNPNKVDANKKKDNQQTASASYGLPTQRGFRYVTGPHYWAEILIYISFVLLSNPHSAHASSCVVPSFAIFWAYRLRPYALLGWVVSNLSVNALHNWVWYQRQHYNSSKTPKYALIPGIF